VVKSQTTFVTIYRHVMFVSSLWLHWTGLRQRCSKMSKLLD